MTQLNTPSPDALAHSEKLRQLIIQDILSNDGHITFARFMELALYAPGLGYYSAGNQKFGKKGDFVTAPEISPLFAQCIARQCQQVLQELGSFDILEFGAGSGKFATDLLAELEQLNSLPQHYFILEVSAELRERQQHLLQTKCPHLLTRIQWLDALPTMGISGVIFANEVLDAMPINLFHYANNTLKERYVSVQDNKLIWQITTPSEALIKPLEHIKDECELTDNYNSEINLMLPAWIQALSTILKSGLILLFDYGYGRREYYHRDRDCGTLMCHYQHQRHSDPLILVGLQDITAHVDFTAVVESAIDAGLNLAGYTTQSAFLFACGLLEIAARDNLTAADLYQQNQQIKLLTLPSQMGEIVKAIGLSKNWDTALLGFSLHDRRRDL